MPFYVVDTMGKIPGLSGLFVAGIFSATLSTVSAAINSLAAVTIEDYYKVPTENTLQIYYSLIKTVLIIICLQPLYLMIFKKSLSEKKTVVQSKMIALFVGLLCLVMAFLAQLLGNILQASLTIFGVIGGPLLALFSLGMFTTTANEKVRCA